MKLLTVLACSLAVLLLGANGLWAGLAASDDCCCEDFTCHTTDCSCPSVTLCSNQPLVGAPRDSGLRAPDLIGQLRCALGDESGSTRTEAPPSQPPERIS